MDRKYKQRGYQQDDEREQRPRATPQPILSKLSSACAEAAKSDLYATIAKNAGQPDDYYADAAAFRLRLARDIDSKARVLSRLKTQ